MIQVRIMMIKERLKLTVQSSIQQEAGLKTLNWFEIKALK